MPFVFTCAECRVVVTISVDVGKDYIFEDTCKESLKYMEDCCNWEVYGRNPHLHLCSECKEVVNADSTS